MRFSYVAAVLLVFSLPSFATEKITLAQYLEEVKRQSPQLQSLFLNVKSIEKRLEEADLALSPIGYVDWRRGEDEKPTTTPVVQGSKTEVDSVTLGVKKQFTFGMAADLSVDRSRINIEGSNLDDPKYTDSRATLSLTQSLWKNGFGELTRAQREGRKAAAKAELMQARYLWRSAMIQAENVYWTLASLQQVVKLQQANVESAEKLSKWMGGRQKLNLVDDVESLQTQAALQARDLELQSSQDQLNQALQTFYTLRGQTTSTAEVELDPLPQEEWATQLKELNQTKKHREDFEALRARAKAEKAQATATKSSLRPQLDLIGSYSSNARNVKESETYREVDDFDKPSWMVGVSFSVPLDFGLTNRLKESTRLKEDSSQFALEQANFEEARTWEDIIRKRKEAQARYEQAINLENIRTKLVSRERGRLRNGRTTTFQAITNEQDLASSQVLRVQTQLNLIQTHNQIKAFVEGL